jgi:Mg2+/Co2+ transporter CorB
MGAGAEATQVFGDAQFGVFSAIMTLLILFLFPSEVVPKTIGAVHAGNGKQRTTAVRVS